MNILHQCLKKYNLIGLKVIVSFKKFFNLNFVFVVFEVCCNLNRFVQNQN